MMDCWEIELTRTSTIDSIKLRLEFKPRPPPPLPLYLNSEYRSTMDGHITCTQFHGGYVYSRLSTLNINGYQLGVCLAPGLTFKKIRYSATWSRPRALDYSASQCEGKTGWYRHASTCFINTPLLVKADVSCNEDLHVYHYIYIIVYNPKSWVISEYIVMWLNLTNSATVSCARREILLTRGEHSFIIWLGNIHLRGNMWFYAND